MKKIFFAVLLAATAFVAKAQQPKSIVYDPNAVERTVDDFTGIQVSGGISLYLSQGNANAVAVSTDEAKDVDKVKTEVKNGVLKIYIESGAWNGWNWKSKKIKAYVTAKSIQKIDASGASSIVITDKITTGELKLDLSGASSLKGDVSASTCKFDINGASSYKGALTVDGKLKISVSGASAVTLSGASRTASIELSGASSFKAYDFTIDNCSIEASGASVANIHVGTELSAEATGASSVRYAGSPNIKRADVSGASVIKKRDN